MSKLNFDGSHLGSHQFAGAISSWWYPCQVETTGRKTVAIYTYLKALNSNGTIERYPIILKRNTQKRTDQVVVDEMKSLFGLSKMGTHQIRLNGVVKKINEQYPWLVQTQTGIYCNAQIEPLWSEYLMFRATSIRKEDLVDFIPLPTLQEAVYYPFLVEQVCEGQQILYRELQKIFVFRDLFRVASSDASDILLQYDPMASSEFKNYFRSAVTHKNYRDPHDEQIKYNLIDLVSNYSSKNPSDRIIPLSIDEMKVKSPTEIYKGLSDSVKNYCLQKTDIHAKALIKMLGLDESNYAARIEVLRNSMSKIVQRIDQEQIWLVDYVISQIMDKVSVYYDLMAK
jgi:hypothetical protein